MFRISQDPSSGSNKTEITKITYNCSTVRVMRCQCLAAYLTCIVCVCVCVCILHRLEVYISNRCSIHTQYRLNMQPNTENA
jgi:hypothetical protein